MIQAIIAGVGLATSLFGANKAKKAEKKAARIQAATSRQALNISNKISAKEQAAADASYNASVKISNYTKKQEALRKDQMINESASQARDIVRQTQLARATGTAIAAAGGGLTSSGFQGSQAGIQASGDEQATTLFGNTQRGLRNFALNEAILKTQVAAQGTIAGYNRQTSKLKTQLNEVTTLGANATARAQVGANTGRAIFSLGQQITSSAQQAGDVAKSLFAQ
jgi:hypothetical protein